MLSALLLMSPAQNSTQLKGKITLIEVVHKQPSMTLYNMMPQFAPDPNYVKLRFAVEELEHSYPEVVVKKADAKKLDLMLGDTIVVTISPHTQSEVQSDASGVHSEAMILSIQMNQVASRSLRPTASLQSRFTKVPASWSEIKEAQEKIQQEPMTPTTRIMQPEPLDPKYFDYVDLNIRFEDAFAYCSIPVKKSDLRHLELTAGDIVSLAVVKA